jgi:hypothetical protein
MAHLVLVEQMVHLVLQALTELQVQVGQTVVAVLQVLTEHLVRLEQTEPLVRLEQMVVVVHRGQAIIIMDLLVIQQHKLYQVVQYPLFGNIIQLKLQMVLIL